MNFICNNRYVYFLFFVLAGLIFSQRSYNQQINGFIYADEVISLPPWPQNKIHSITRDSLGYFYVSVQDRIYHFSDLPREIAYTGSPMRLCYTAQGTIFLGGKNGFGLLMKSGSGDYRIRKLPAGSGASPGQVYAMLALDTSCYALADSGLYLLTISGAKKVLQGNDIKGWKWIEPSFLFVLAGDTLSGIYPGGQVNEVVRGSGKNIMLSIEKSGHSILVSIGTKVIFSAGKEGILKGMNQLKLQKGSFLTNPGIFANGNIVDLPLPGTICYYPSGREESFTWNFNIPQSNRNPPGVFLKDNELFVYSDYVVYRPWIPPQFYYYSSGELQNCLFPKQVFIIHQHIGIFSGNQLTFLKAIHNKGTVQLECLGTKELPGEAASFSKVIAFPDFAFLVCSSGIYQTGPSGLTKVFAGSDIYAAEASGDKKYLLVLSGNSLLRIPVRNTGNAVKLKADAEIMLPGRDFYAIGSKDGYQIFLSAGGSRILEISTDNKNRYSIDTLNISPGMGYYLISSSSGVFMITQTGVYRYDSLTGEFQPDENFPDIEPAREWIYPYNVSNDGKKIRLVYRSDVNRLNNRIIEYEPGKIAEQRLIKEYDYNIGSLAEDDSGRLWLAGNRQLIMIMPSVSLPGGIPGKMLLHDLIFGTDTFIYHGHSIRAIPSAVPFRSNFLRVNFGTSWFGNNDLILTRYRLEGYMQQFTGWGKENEAVFYRLKPGRYTFYAESGYSGQKPVSRLQFSFVVLPPAYLRWYAFLMYTVLLGFVAFIIIRWRSWKFMQEKIKLEALVSARTEELIREKDRTEQLISKMLPRETADELKKKGKATSQKYEMVTVLFSDIQGFTKIAEQMNPETLIDQLDVFYLHFDSVVEKYNIEKIKTIGDAYMCAGGIPEKNRTNPVDVVLAALEMQQYMREMKAQNANFWELRIGIHTGPVIAGVIGQKKYSYDIWGDTVNVASRMESSGEAGKVNISGQTYELVRDFFICEYRGKMPVKYKGEIEMYFVKGIRPELSLNLKGMPNQRFFLMLQNLRLLDLQEYIQEKLLEKAPPEMYFHNAVYAEEIFMQSELLGRAEGLSEEELLLVRTASLFECPGYILDYFNPVEKNLAYADELLPRFKYNREQIDKIKKLILSSEKTNHDWIAEKVLHDARTSFYGRKDFPARIKAMLEEMHAHGQSVVPEEWLKEVSARLKKFAFYTETARKLAEISPQEQETALMEVFRKLDKN
ncbi:MAG TPA: adenylate/guanylate cyclase domain-containing protein [Bacteroidales bacterium]|nr:adenylate/guanylate cyclase domain-containing protein [Bacteroidales bacterium]